VEAQSLSHRSAHHDSCRHPRHILEGSRKRRVRHEGQGIDDDTDPWNLVPRDELPLLSLDEVFAVVGRRPSRIDDEDTILIAVRVAPDRIQGQSWRTLRMKVACPNSRLALLTSWHGIARLEAKPPIQLLRPVIRSNEVSGDGQR